MTVTIRNTADHYLVPGDEQVLDLEGVEYRVVSVTPIIAHGMILTYGLRLVSAVVEAVLEPANEPVVIQ